MTNMNRYHNIALIMTFGCFAAGKWTPTVYCYFYIQVCMSYFWCRMKPCIWLTFVIAVFFLYNNCRCLILVIFHACFVFNINKTWFILLAKTHKFRLDDFSFIFYIRKCSWVIFKRSYTYSRYFTFYPYSFFYSSLRNFT